jgi:nucleoredoxin
MTIMRLLWMPIIALFIASCGAGEGAPVPAPKSIDLGILTANLVQSDGTVVVETAHPKSRYTVVYYSASWCPPCKKFTPKLVRFVESSAAAVRFRVILMSGDVDQQSAGEYMRESGMTWPMVRQGSPAFERFAELVNSPYIPYLLVLDEQGRVVIDCVQQGEQVQPEVVLDQFAELLTR